MRIAWTILRYWLYASALFSLFISAAHASEVIRVVATPRTAEERAQEEREFKKDYGQYFGYVIEEEEEEDDDDDD